MKSYIGSILIGSLSCILFLLVFAVIKEIPHSGQCYMTVLDYGRFTILKILSYNDGEWIIQYKDKSDNWNSAFYKISDSKVFKYEVDCNLKTSQD